MNICNASAFSMWVFVFCIACNRHTSVHVWAYVVACAMHNVIMYVWLGYVMYGWIQGSMGYAEDTVCLAGSYSQRIGVLWCFVEVQLLVSSCISTLNLVYIYIHAWIFSLHTSCHDHFHDKMTKSSPHHSQAEQSSRAWSAVPRTASNFIGKCSRFMSLPTSAFRWSLH